MPTVPHLVYLDPDPGQSEQYSYALKDGVTIIGTEGEIALQGDGVEPYHAEVHNDRGEVSVVPVNGVTYVNGKKVTSVTPMGQGGRLVLGSLFFRLHNPTKKEWVNPPGYQYALEELQREQEIAQRRERRRQPSDDGRRKSDNPDLRRKGSRPRWRPSVLPSAREAEAETERQFLVLTPPPDLPVADLMEANGCHSPDSSGSSDAGDRADLLPRAPPLGSVRHVAAVTANRRRSTLEAQALLGRHTAPVTLRAEEAAGQAVELQRLRLALKEAEQKYQQRIVEAERRAEEERRRAGDLERAVAALEKRLKEKVRQEMCDRGEGLVGKADELVREAQHLTFIVGKPLQFTMKLQTCWDETVVSLESVGPGASTERMQSEGAILIRDSQDAAKSVTVELPRFVPLLQEMRVIHQRLVEAVEKGQPYVVPRAEDPWEQLFDAYQYVGSTRIWLEELLHNVAIESLSAFVMDNAGNKVGEVTVDFLPCRPTGEPLGDDPELFVDDDEITERWLGQPWDALLTIRELRLAHGNRYTQLYLGYTFWLDPTEYTTPKFRADAGSASLTVGFVQQHRNAAVDAPFLEYLKSHSLQLKLYAAVETPAYTPISAADERIVKLLLRSSKPPPARRPLTAPPEINPELEKLETKCRQQDRTIGELRESVKSLQTQLGAAADEAARLGVTLAERDAQVAELKQKKRELNALLKSEKEKFLARQAQLKEKLAAFQKAAEAGAIPAIGPNSAESPVKDSTGAARGSRRSTPPSTRLEAIPGI